MAIEWKAAPFQALPKVVLMVSLAMLVYQVYLSFAEYKKYEYIQAQEESNLSKVTLPMIVGGTIKATLEKLKMKNRRVISYYI